MPKILALTAIGALAALLVINTIQLHGRAQAVFVPIPTARAAASFPAAPAAAAAPALADSPAFPEAPDTAQPASVIASAAKVAAAPVKVKAAAVKKPAAQAPVQLSIPSIGLRERVVPVGINSKGDLSVPAGSTSDIGWYAKGPMPGDTGSAVMDAHVFAGFSHLDEAAAGDSIYVGMADGTTRRFVVTKAKVFALADLSPQELYSRNDGRYLHLITCAGSLTPDRSTYTHRLVVYATLAE